MASAGVKTVRYDLSGRVAEFAGMYGLIVDNFDRGPVNQRAFISDPQTADLVLGTPGPLSTHGYHIMHSFLTKAKRLWIYRVVDQAKYGGVILGASYTSTLERQENVALTGTLTFTKGEIIVNGAGTAFTTELKEGDYIFLDDEDVEGMVQVDEITDDTTLSIKDEYSLSSSVGTATLYQGATFAGTVAFERCLPGTVSVWVDKDKVAYDNAEGEIFGTIVENGSIDYDTGELKVSFTADSEPPGPAVVYGLWGFPTMTFEEAGVDDAVYADPTQYDWLGRQIELTVKNDGAGVYEDVLPPAPLNGPIDPVTDETTATFVIYDGEDAIIYADEFGALVNKGTSTYLDAAATNQINYANGELGFTLDGGFTPTNDLVVKYTSNNADIGVVYADNPGEWSKRYSVMVHGYVFPDNTFKIDVYEDNVVGGQTRTTVAEERVVSRETKVDGNNKQLNVEEQINGNSYNMRVFDNPWIGETEAVPTSTIPHTALDTSRAFEYMTGGDNGFAPSAAAYLNALKTFNNKEDIDVSIVMDTLGTAVYHHAIDGLCNRTKGGRGDCYGILYTPFELEESTNYIVDLLNFRNYEQNLNTEWCGLYTSHVQIYDSYNSRKIWIPPVGFVAAAFSYTADMYEPWFPAAGWRRGLLPVLDVYRRYKEGERDVLYDNGINPMRFKPGKGIAIWGQKTLYGSASALDRANVSWLLIVTENAVENFLDDYVFELNDAFTRKLVQSGIEAYYANIQARRGVYAYNIVCDETNNSPQDIDNYKMNVDVYVQPAKAAEFIKQRVIITRTGVDFGSVSIG